MRWSRNYFPPNEVPEAKPNPQPLIPETNSSHLKIHPLEVWRFRTWKAHHFLGGKNVSFRERVGIPYTSVDCFTGHKSRTPLRSLLREFWPLVLPGRSTRPTAGGRITPHGVDPLRPYRPIEWEAGKAGMPTKWEHFDPTPFHTKKHNPGCADPGWPEQSWTRKRLCCT